MPSLGTRVLPWSGGELTLIRHDFSGMLGVEVIAEPELAQALWEFLTAPERHTPAALAGSDALNICRIESGIPWVPHEINDGVLPAETGQLERAVSYQKGCYLGQEVVERMRSRGGLARKLCGLVLTGDTIPECGSAIADADGAVVGSTASACPSPATRAVIALAYVKTATAKPGTRVSVAVNGTRIAGTVSDLPFAVPATA